LRKKGKKNQILGGRKQ